MTQYLLLLLTSICWGSWGNALKFAKKYPPNLFYLDFTLGALLLAVLIWLFNFSGLGFFTSLTLVPLLGGALFAFGNLLLVKAIDRYGFSLSFPSIIGGAVIVGGLTNYLKTPQNNPLMFFAGLALVVGAIVVDGYLYKSGRRKQVNYLLFLAGAIFIGLFPLFWNYGSASLATSELFLVLLVGHFLGIILASLFAGYLAAADLKKYIHSLTSNHIISLVGALIWVFGTYLNILIGAKVGYGISFVIGNIAPLFSAAWGIFYWREIDIRQRNNLFIFASMAGLFFSGMVLLGLS